MSDFSRNLIKGRIAEVVFAQMFREAGKYTVLPFGYENLTPELAQYLSNSKPSAKRAIESIRTAPDFALISHSHKEVYLVEVKYRAKLNKSEILRSAKRMLNAWNPSWLFIATKEGFYIDLTTAIVKNKGAIRPLRAQRIPRKLQDKYLELLREFER